MSAGVFQSSPVAATAGFTRHRMPVILQSEHAECGLACLAMIACHYGYRTDIGRIRRQFEVSGHGTTLKHLISLAGKLRISCRALKLEPGALNDLRLPCVLHWDMNHFVVLKKIGRRSLTIHDPARGARRVTWNEFSQHFTGVALELWPMEGFSQGSDVRRLRLAAFWERGQGLGFSLAQVLFLSALLQLFALIAPIYTQIVVDEVVLREDLNLLAVLAMAFAILLFIEIGTSALRQFILIRVASNLNMQMASRLFHHLIRLPMAFYEKRHVGDIVSRFGSLDAIRHTITTSAISTVVDGLLAISALIAMYWYDTFLATVVLVSVALYLGLRLALFPSLRRVSEEGLAAVARKDTSFLESIRAIQTLKLFNKEDERQNQWQNHLADTINNEIKIAKFGIGFDTANRLLLNGGNVLVIYFAATSVINGVITLGMFFAFISFRRHFVSAMEALVDNIIELRMLGLHLQRIADIAFTEKENYHRSENRSIISKTLDGKVEARNLSYRHSKDSPLLFEDLSFTVESGDIAAISGPSGSGKTTLIRCLMGLLAPERGEIQVDGRSIERIYDFRQRIGVVMQNDQLLTGSIAENICCFEQSLNLNQVIECAEQACIHEDIMKFPMQYNTMIGDMSSNLSGGQVQRIAIARALYRKPLILFIDEATSQIHNELENTIMKNIRSLGVTTIVISHRELIHKIASCEIKLAG